MLKWTTAGYCHMGKVRQNNEDNLLICRKFRDDLGQEIWKTPLLHGRKGGLFAVCDGMGGEEYGERASLAAVQALCPQKFHKTVNVMAKIHQANHRICHQMKEQGSRMGTTCVALELMEHGAQITNLGDSRCYLLRNGVLKQLTTDYTEYQSRINMGFSPESLVNNHRAKHTLTQYLGIPSDEMLIEPEQIKIPALQAGDVFLLCSDGLTDMVGDCEMQQILNQNGKPDVACAKLVDKALSAGGRDNITVVVIHITGISL